MPSVLKEELSGRLRQKLAERGLSSLYDQIATEREAETIDELAGFLERVGHPALSLKPLL
jgi:CO dehydrogenase/acetyl-CoA synthase beta subunit